MAIVTEMVRQRWPQDRAMRTLQNPRNSGGEALRTDRRGRVLSTGRALKRFRYTWDRAELYVASLPAFRDRYDVVETLLEVREAAGSLPWPGRAGATDRVVLGALLDIALTAGRTEIHASVRDLAGATAMGVATISRALGRLQSTGWIVRRTRARRAHAAVWRIKANRAEHSGFGNDALQPRSVPVDTFCWAGLGWSKGRVYALLSAEITPTSQIAGALEVGVRTVQKHLAALKGHGLAVRQGEGWTRGPTDPAEVARILGTRGRQEAQRELHRRTREQFRARTVPPGVDPGTGEIHQANRAEHSGFPSGGVTECSVEFAPEEMVLSLKVTEEQAVQIEEELRREGMLAS